MKPRLLDLFCGAGGASCGYARAGFDVDGVDIEPHPDYPYRLTVADAMEVLQDPAHLDSFDVIHASPPCQGYTTMSNRFPSAAAEWPRLIEPVRDALTGWGGLYVIENVPGARKHMRSPLTLHGGMFGLGVHRPRLFETNAAIMLPQASAPTNPIGVYGKAHDGRLLWRRTDGSELHAASTLEQGQRAMGIDWMNWDDLREAIPPAYTTWLGTQLLDHLRAAA